MNKVELIGNLTKDVDVRTSQGGSQVARFTVAVQRQGGDNPTADFIPCVAFAKTAELCGRYLHKGSKVGIEGSIRTGSYTAQDGSKRYTTDVAVDRVEFLTPKGGAANDNNAPAAGSGTFDEVDPDPDEFPWV